MGENQRKSYPRSEQSWGWWLVLLKECFQECGPLPLCLASPPPLYLLLPGLFTWSPMPTPPQETFPDLRITFLMLCSHHYFLVPDIFITPKGRPYTHLELLLKFPFPSPWQLLICFLLIRFTSYIFDRDTANVCSFFYILLCYTILVCPITGNVHSHLLNKVVFARFCNCTVSLFPFTIDDHFVR